MVKEYVEVCIVGGGIVGLMCADALSQQGCSVRLVDRHYMGPQRGNVVAITRHGHAAQATDFMQFSQKCWKESMGQHAKDIGMVPLGSLQWALTADEVEPLRAAQRADADAGFTSHFMDDREAMASLLGGFNASESVLGCWLRTGDMALRSDQALDIIRQRLIRQGVRIWGADDVCALLMNKEHICGVQNTQGDVCMAQHVVICAGAYTGALLDTLGLHMRLRPARAHVMEIEVHTPLPLPTIVQPYQEGVLRLQAINQQRALLSYDGLMDPAQATYAAETDPEIEQFMLEQIACWADGLGQVRKIQSWVMLQSVTPDLAPVIGEVSSHPGLYVVAGLQAQTYAYAAGAARLICDAILDEQQIPEALCQSVSPRRLLRGKWQPCVLSDLYPVLSTPVSSEPTEEDAPTEEHPPENATSAEGDTAEDAEDATK